MARKRRLALSGTALAVILILLLSGCGTIEIRIEQPGSTRAVASPVAEIRPTELAS